MEYLEFFPSLKLTYRRRTGVKHIDIRKHLSHEVIQNGQMKLIRVATANQLADILTKPLHFPQWQACVAGILNKMIVTTEGTFVLKRGAIAKAIKLSHVGP